jgi:hypothetical protein
MSGDMAVEHYSASCSDRCTMFDMQKTERLAIRLDPALREQLRQRAVAEDRPEGAMARRLIAESLRQDERQEVG